MLRKLFGLGRSGKTRETVKRKRAKRKTAKRSKGGKRRSSEVTRLLRRIYATKDSYAIRAAQEALGMYEPGDPYYGRKWLIRELREILAGAEERAAEGRYA